MSKRSHAFLVSVESTDIEDGAFVLVKIDDQLARIRWLIIAGGRFYIPEDRYTIIPVPPDLEIIGIMPSINTFIIDIDHYSDDCCSDDQDDQQKSN